MSVSFSKKQLAMHPRRPNVGGKKLDEQKYALIFLSYFSNLLRRGSMGCYVYPQNGVSAGAKPERVDLASTEFYACTHFSQRSLCEGERGYPIILSMVLPISYPESSGFLVSGWAPVETLENSEKN